MKKTSILAAVALALALSACAQKNRSFSPYDCTSAKTIACEHQAEQQTGDGGSD